MKKLFLIPLILISIAPLFSAENNDDRSMELEEVISQSEQIVAIVLILDAESENASVQMTIIEEANANANTSDEKVKTKKAFSFRNKFYSAKSFLDILDMASVNMTSKSHQVSTRENSEIHYFIFPL
tara:strand:- start:220 stop:600 length:381 start_codon:yes stop_codon:yes gene_type:complete